MKKYQVEVREEFSKMVIIEAIDEDEARDKVEDEYLEGNITLDPAEDFTEWNMYVHGEIDE